MRNIWTIADKELRTYFSSPIAYGLMAFFSLLVGFVFAVAINAFVSASMQSASMGPGFALNMNDYIVRPVFSNMAVFSLFIIPMITMRLFAEEKRQGTFELLATSPISDAEIVVGKWLAALLMYLGIVLFASISLIILFMYGEPDWKPMLTGFLGIVLQGGALLAIGTFLSSLTRNQIIAGISGFAVCLLLWIVSWMTEFKTDTASQVLSYLSVVTHAESFSKGVLNTKDLLYYVSLTFLALFLTTRSLESIRWRG